MASSASTPIRPIEGDEGGISSPQPVSPARAAVDVIAVTAQDDFLLELGEALGGQASINPVESAAQAVQQLGNSKRPQVLMLDSRGLTDVRADVDTVQTQAQHAIVLVFASVEAEQQVATALKGSSVFAILPLPIDARKTAAVFGGGVANFRAKQAAATQPAPDRGPPLIEATAPAPAVREPIRPMPQEDAAESRFTPPVIAGAIALALLAGGLIWYLARDKAPETPASAMKSTVTATPAPVETALPAVETSLVKGQVDELLEKARLAMRERRYTEPAGNNALLYYRSAVAADSANGEAVDGLSRVGSVLASRFDETLSDNQYDDAATALAQFKNALPDDSRIASFQLRLTTAQVAKALADDNPDRAAALVRAAQQAGTIPAAQLAKWRSDITRVQDAARAKREAEQAARETAAAEQKKARDAKAAAAAEAERLAQAARDKAREEQLKEQQAVKTAQETASASSTATTRPAVSLQSSLKRKRYVAPEYPADALARHLGGVVTVSFSVDTKGEPRDVRVEVATPPGVFDRAAIAAVKRWRYEPLLVDGVATEVPVRLAIRFAPQD